LENTVEEQISREGMYYVKSKRNTSLHLKDEGAEVGQESASSWSSFFQKWARHHYEV
jgi:hypothetical protein